MPEAQLPEYRALLTDEFGKLRQLRSTTAPFVGDLNIVLRGDFAGGDWLARGIKAEDEAQAAYREDFAKMAAEIDAEDAAAGEVCKGGREEGRAMSVACGSAGGSCTSNVYGNPRRDPHRACASEGRGY
jgi:hypothetical protein